MIVNVVMLATKNEFQMSLDSAVGMATNIKATPLDISITGQPIGIATSHNGLFVAVAEM